MSLPEKPEEAQTVPLKAVKAASPPERTSATTIDRVFRRFGLIAGWLPTVIILWGVLVLPMPAILRGALIIFLLASAGVSFTVSYLLRHHSKWKNHNYIFGSYCATILDNGQECARRIRNCDHQHGVPSNWHHLDDRTHRHPNGELVWPR